MRDSFKIGRETQDEKQKSDVMDHTRRQVGWAIQIDYDYSMGFYCRLMVL